MQSVGQKLRLAREAQHRTLYQVNASTRISVRILEALEADDLNCVSSAFFYRSFVRQFADDVELNYAEVAEAVSVVADGIPVPSMPGQGSIQPPKVAALQIGRRKSPRLVRSITSLAVVLIACSGVYAMWQNAKLHLPAAWQKVAAAGSLPAINPGAVSNDASSPPSSSNPNGFTLELSATEPAWLSITADGKLSFDGILERSETKFLEGHRTARVMTRNAGVVKVVFNGKPLGALGARGQVKTVLFTKNNYEVLRSPTRVSWLDLNQTAALKLPLVVLPLPGS